MKVKKREIAIFSIAVMIVFIVIIAICDIMVSRNASGKIYNSHLLHKRYLTHSKIMKAPLFVLLSLILLSCLGCTTKQTSDSESLHTDSVFVYEFYKSINGIAIEDVEDLIRIDLQHLDSTYFVEYDSPINGYSVKAVLKDLSPICLNVYTALAYMWFTDSCSTRSILHPTFALNDSIAEQLKTRTVNKLNCNIIPDEYYNSNQLGQFQDVPFAFFDVDFDGEKELLLRHPFVGQRSRSTYSPFRLSSIDHNRFEADYIYASIDSAMMESDKYAHYPILDDMVQFDNINKTIILHASAGAWENEWHYYKDCKLIKKIVEYIDGGERKVKRIIYKGDKTIEIDITLDKGGSYSID